MANHPSGVILGVAYFEVRLLRLVLDGSGIPVWPVAGGRGGMGRLNAPRPLVLAGDPGGGISGRSQDRNALAGRRDARRRQRGRRNGRNQPEVSGRPPSLSLCPEETP